MAASQGVVPSPRTLPFVASSHKILYLWGGYEDEEPEAIYLYDFNSRAWMRKITQGPHPPAGLWAGGCVLAGRHLYLYGGCCKSSKSSGKLYRLGIDNWMWWKLSDYSVWPNWNCALIVYKNKLLLFGGDNGKQPGCRKPEPRQPGASNSNLCNNEAHYYDLSSGSWSSLFIKGSRPPPYYDFCVTMIDEEHAVMFGGDKSADVHVLDIPKSSWTHLPHRDGDPRPAVTVYQLGVCLGYGGEHKRVLVGTGLYKYCKVPGGIWLLDPLSGKWEEVKLFNKELLQMSEPVAASFPISPKCVEVVVFGTRNSSMVTVVMRFELQGKSIDEKSWVLTSITDNDQLADVKNVREQLQEKQKKIKKSKQVLGELQKKAEESQRRAKEFEKRAEESKQRIANLQRKVEESEMRANKYQEEAVQLLRKEEELQETAVHLQKRIDKREPVIGHVLGESTSTYTGKAMDIEVDDLGIHIHLEDQDLPRNVAECRVSVTAAASGNFNLPKNSELVSGVYKIYSTFKPQKPATVTIQHCAAEDGIGSLKFASSTDNIAYELIDGGTFTPTHGEIEIDDFRRYYTILNENYGKEGLLSLHQKKYQLSLHCSKKFIVEKSEEPTQLSWYLYFTMVKDCAIFQRSVDRFFHEFKSEVKQLGNIIVKFKKDAQAIGLTLKEDKMKLQRGWSLQRYVSCVFKKDVIDTSVDVAKPSHFRLMLLQNSDENPQDLFHKFKLEGADDPECFINIFQPAVPTNGVILGPSQMVFYEEYLKKIKQSKMSALQRDIKDDGHIRQISKFLYGWEEKCYEFGLSTKPDVLDIREGRFRNNLKQQRMEALFEWKRRSFQVTYENLLKICAKCGFNESADKIVSIINDMKLN